MADYASCNADREYYRPECEMELIYNPILVHFTVDQQILVRESTSNLVCLTHQILGRIRAEILHLCSSSEIS